jgi:hypothetical protein
MQTEARTFRVHVEDDERHCRRMEGVSFEDAAAAFVADLHPAEEEVTVIVIDEANGRRQCLRVDVGTGEPGPCA